MLATAFMKPSPLDALANAVVQKQCARVVYPHLLQSRSFEGVPGSLGKSQKEGQEDQEEVNKLGGNPLTVLRSPDKDLKGRP